MKSKAKEAMAIKSQSFPFSRLLAAAVYVNPTVFVQSRDIENIFAYLMTLAILQLARVTARGGRRVRAGGRWKEKIERENISNFERCRR